MRPFLFLITLFTFALVKAEAVPSGKEVTKRQAESGDSNERLPPFIELLRGRDGRDGRDGEPGPKGSPGATAEKGDTGPQGPPGPSSGGVTYIRWGRTTCPNTPGTERVYSGRAAGTSYNVQGGTSDYLCLPDTPEYSTYRPGVQGYSPIHGAEYETNHATLPIPGVYEHNVPCAVCLNSQRKAVLTIPACITCPSSWTLE
ncbi:Short-chain collagen C4 (Fragment) [Geodia barretti]|uniref:Short-chain collagen C4 n=1 Tax=Geodia barretti TaxID=519541 RepID=A0AA35TDN1_GEOBA